jgi:hypothetical protein
MALCSDPFKPDDVLLMIPCYLFIFYFEVRGHRKGWPEKNHFFELKYHDPRRFFCGDFYYKKTSHHASVKYDYLFVLILLVT